MRGCNMKPTPSEIPTLPVTPATSQKSNQETTVPGGVNKRSIHPVSLRDNRWLTIVAGPGRDGTILSYPFIYLL
jgi:hypothetical protein